MTNKRKRFYEIALIACCLIIISLTAYMGITAIQKSLTLKLSFEVNPQFEVLVKYKKASDNTYATLFCNTNEGGNVPEVGTLYTLNGNVLTFKNDQMTDLGTTLDFEITNYSSLTDGMALKVTAKCGEVELGKAYVNSYSNNNASTGYLEDVNIANGAPITLTFEEAEPSYAVTFNSTNNVVTSPNMPNAIPADNTEDIVITLNASTSDYSSGTPTVEGTCVYSFDITTGKLTLSNVQSDIKITANKQNPWIFGQYVGTGASTIGTIVSGTDVYYPAYEGYYYVEFAEAKTYFNSDQNKTYPMRWIIIGSGENFSESTMLEAIQNHITADESDFYEVPASAYKGTVNGVAGTNDELDPNQVLLLSEYVLSNRGFTSLTYEDDYYEQQHWAMTTVTTLRHWLNDSAETDFLKSSNLYQYMTSYIATPKSMKTSWGKSSETGISGYTYTEDGNASITDLSTTKIFLLATDTMTSIGTFAEYSYDKMKSQDFLLQDYLGRCKDRYPELNTKIFSVPNASYWMLRTGCCSGVIGYDFGCVDGYGIRVEDEAGAVLHGGIARGVRPSFVLNLE